MKIFMYIEHKRLCKVIYFSENFLKCMKTIFKFLLFLFVLYTQFQLKVFNRAKHKYFIV